MNKIEKWIKENTWRGHVDELALRELLKTHAIVPREATPSQILHGAVSMGKRDKVNEMYKAMIEAEENE